MTGRRSAVGLCLLCALAFGALAAQAASAATNGTTAFTCRNEGPGHAFAKAHCTATDAVGGEYEQVSIGEGTTTSIIGTAGTTSGEKSVTKLKAAILGITWEFQAKGLDLEGSLTNLKDEGGEHFVSGEGKITYTEASVTAPAGKGCKVKGGKIETKQLTTTTTGQEDALKFAPKTGESLAEFTLEGCSPPSLNISYNLTGSVKGTPDGATVAFTHSGTTGQKTLELNGWSAGLEGSTTLSGRDPVLEETSFSPLSFKTVETP